MSNIRPFQRSEPCIPVSAPTFNAPRVFTESFQSRLASLTAVERQLRQMGLHVIWSRLAGPKPQAHIQRDATVSVGPLLDKMGPRSFAPGDGCVVVSGEFNGVIVSWVEPNQ